MSAISLPADRPFQSGLRLSVLSPFITFIAGAVALSVSGAHPETGMGWSILHVAAFGVIQLTWITPLAGTCAIMGKRRFALGLVVGAMMLLVANGLAWAIGLSIGAK
jgi:hypothetical protein